MTTIVQFKWKKKNSIWNVMLIVYYCFSRYIKYWNGHLACQTMPKISLGMHTVRVCSGHLYCEVGCSCVMKCLLHLPGCTDWNETSREMSSELSSTSLGCSLYSASGFLLKLFTSSSKLFKAPRQMTTKVKDKGTIYERTQVLDLHLHTHVKYRNAFTW